MVKVGVCVCTYKRPQLLIQLLKTLNTQVNIDDIDVSFIIVNNDVESNISNHLNTLKMNNIYCYLESSQGISNARNQCIRRCKEMQLDYLIFIDDDEWVGNDWLYNMMRAAKIFEADVVKGPVKTVYNNSTPKWIIESGFYEETSYETGAILEHCASGNTLVKLGVILENDHYFDQYYGLTGGEDTKFFKGIHDCGGKNYLL